MFKWICGGFVCISLIVGSFNGHLFDVLMSAINSIKIAIKIGFGLLIAMTIWLFVMSIFEQLGIINILNRLVKPVMIRLFPDVPSDHPAIGSITCNIVANMCGLVNAATPFGLKAMKELQSLNSVKHTASNAMCTFLAINTSSVQLLPVSAITFLAASGADHPFDIVYTSLIATIFSTIAGVSAVKFFEKLPFYQRTAPTMREVSHGR